MATNSCFGQIMEEGDDEAFFKILRRKELLSETMRGIPHNIIKSLSERELSGKMVLKLPWGSSWPINICKNAIFYYMEKTGWEQFLSGNGLGNDEFVTFTHKGNMCFSVDIYQIDGKEMLRPRKSATIASTSSQNKREQRNKDVKMEETESLSESSCHVMETAESTRGRLRQKREFCLGKKKAEESENSKKKKVDTSSLVPQFTRSIKKSYLNFLGIPKEFMDMHMPAETTMFKIHHPNGKKSWEVKYMVTNAQSRFSAGWIGLVKDLDLVIGDVCTFKLIKPTELLLKVTKKKRSMI